MYTSDHSGFGVMFYFFSAPSACDLPQRSNEAHIFYGNMSKVAVSLMGTTKSTDCEERNEAELLLSSGRHGPDSDGYCPQYYSQCSSILQPVYFIFLLFLYFQPMLNTMNFFFLILSALANGSVSLDVLPVKGPQGPPLNVTEPSLKVTRSHVSKKGFLIFLQVR